MSVILGGDWLFFAAMKPVTFLLSNVTLPVGLISYFTLPPPSFTCCLMICPTFRFVSPFRNHSSPPPPPHHLSLSASTVKQWTWMTSQLSPASPSLWSPVGVIRSLLAARCIATSRHVTTAPSSPVPSRDVDANYIFLCFFCCCFFFCCVNKVLKSFSCLHENLKAWCTLH